MCLDKKGGGNVVTMLESGGTIALGCRHASVSTLHQTKKIFYPLLHLLLLNLLFLLLIVLLFLFPNLLLLFFFFPSPNSSVLLLFPLLFLDFISPSPPSPPPISPFPCPNPPYSFFSSSFSHSPSPSFPLLPFVQLLHSRFPLPPFSLLPLVQHLHSPSLPPILSQTLLFLLLFPLPLVLLSNTDARFSTLVPSISTKENSKRGNFA